jgi:NAD(P)-dependent dehydrogenase (short-subunit alcohol dehydrogenase family)
VLAGHTDEVPTALITGASTGIGRATALGLAASGWTVLAGVRKTADGEALQTVGGERVIPLELDVTDPGQIARAVERVAELTGDPEGGPSSAQPGRLDALVNNAGSAVGGPLELISMDDLRRQFDVNFFGHVAVTQALIPALRRARGRIVLISSVGGLVTTPFLAPYHASKYALEAAANSLRLELARSHIQVALIEPGSVATPIWEKNSGQVDEFSIPEELREQYGHVPAAMAKALHNTARRGIPPERVAQTIERALSARRMRARYLIGLDAHAMVWASRLLPDLLFDRLLRRAVGV